MDNLKRFAIASAGTPNNAVMRNRSMDIPLDSIMREVLDIYLVKVNFTFSVTVSGTIAFVLGLSHKQRKETDVPYISIADQLGRKDWLLNYFQEYQAPSEYITDDQEWNFIPYPITTWVSPSLVYGTLNSGGTILAVNLTVELFGKIRTATEDEYNQLQIAQRQEKR